MPLTAFSLAAVIPALDQHSLTRRCVDTLTAAIPPQVALKIVIVDDGSVEPYAAADYPDALLVRHERNCGYTQAVNHGITTALEQYRPHAILLLNNDIEFHPSALARLIRELDFFDVVGPFGRFDPGDEIRYVPYVEFSCALIRAEVFTRVGLLDPRFEQGYYSDDDFCVRCAMAGFWLGQLWRVEPPDIVHHLGRTYGSARQERIAASYPIFMEKWGASDHPAVKNYIRDYLWNPKTRGFGLLRRATADR